MADKATPSKTSASKSDTTDNSAKIHDLLAQAQDLMVEDGMDPGTAEALTNFARPGSPAVVGNLADLQRMGAIAVTGEVPVNAMPTGDQGVQQTSNIQDAFAEPSQAVAPATQQISAEISAAAAKAEEKAK